jgi:hypothetical protein
MNIKNLLSTFTIIICIHATADAQITFQRIYGGNTYDRGYCTAQTNDGGYILTGVSSSFGAGNGDVYLVKTNAVGDTMWTKTFGGANAEEGHSVQQTQDSGYIVAGYTSSFGSRGYIIKTDVNGSMQWSKTIGGSAFDLIVAVQQTTDLGYIIAGNTISFGSGGFDDYLIKLDANGNIVWTKTYGAPNSDYATSVNQTTDGGYIIAGYTNSFSVGNFDDFYLIKTDANGTLIWSKTYGGTNQDEATSVEQTSDGGYIMAGTTTSFGAGASDVYVVKTDSSGVVTWSKTYGGTGSEFGSGISQTTDHGYIITGSTSSFGAGGDDAYLIRTDSMGNTQWSKTYGGASNDYGKSVKQTTDGGYIVTGYTSSLALSDYVYMIKTDANGNSGCNQGNPSTITGTPATVTGTPTSFSNTGGTTIIPNTLIGSGNIGITLCLSLGVNNVSDENINTSVLPNPFTNELIIKGTTTNGVAILLDITGKEILNQKTFDTETKIKTNNLLPGFYLLNYSEKNKSQNRKVVKL